MSAFDVFAIVLIVGAIVAVATVVISHAFRFAVQVEPRIEWAVISSVFGEIDALGAGTHYLAPGWKEVDRVPTSIQESSETGEEVRTKNSIRLALDERLNFVAGHEMPPIEVNNVATDWYDVDPVTVNREMVIRASRSIDPGKVTQPASIREQVKLAVDAACEEVFGFYNDEQLLDPRAKKPIVPPNDPNHQIPGMVPTKATSVSQLYPLLSEFIRRIANRSLQGIGVGLISITITNLRYFDKILQEATESGRRKLMIAKATKDLGKKLPGAADLSTREMLLVGDQTFSIVAAAEAEAKGKVGAAKAIQDGITSIATAITSAAKDLRGVIPPPPSPPTNTP